MLFPDYVKEVRGEAFDIRELLPALRTVGLEDLAQKMLNILDSKCTPQNVFGNLAHYF